MSALGDPIILDYGDSLLKQSDLHLLTDTNTNWLNDTLIGFYYEYLSHEVFPLKGNSPVRMKFFSPQVSQCVKFHDNPEVFIDTSDGELSSYDWLYFAVNNSVSTDELVSGSHWSLMVYCKADAAFYHLDSQPRMNTHAATDLYNKFKGILRPEPVLKQFTVEPQDNGYDCGFHVLANSRLVGEHILNGGSLSEHQSKNNLQTATPAAAQEMRKTLIQLIREIRSRQRSR